MQLKKRWTITDKHGDQIYLTQERWEHITEPFNHPEMAHYEEGLKETIWLGQRKQDSLNPRKYRYLMKFDALAEDNTHIVAIVLFRFREQAGEVIANDYIVTAYQKEIGEKIMKKTNYNYDEISDTLYIAFDSGEKATGIELNNNILLRINKEERKVVGITLFDYSLLAQKADFGPRSFPLTGLLELATELRELVLEILQSSPVAEILTLSTYTPAYAEPIPITSLAEVPIPLAG